MDNLNNFGDNLKAAIQRSGFTQKELSEILRINQDTITNYIKGKSMPRVDTFYNICKTLNVSADSLLIGKELQGGYNNSFANESPFISKEHMSYTVSAGKKISYIRLKSGMNEEEFSNELEIDKKTLAEFEEGKIPIPSYVLYVIYKKFNINPAFLLDPEVVSDKSPEEDVPKSMVDLEKESLYFYNKLPEEEKEEISKLILWKYEKLSKRGQSSTLNNGEGEEAVTKEMA